MEINTLQYITNGKSKKEILEEVTTAIESGVTWIQLRIKSRDVDFKGVAEKVQEICKSKAVFIINDRAKLAKELDADGVHLGKDDMSIFQARALLGTKKIIGGTANSLRECINHEKNGASYIGLGPLRETTTKEKLAPILGMEGYEEIVPSENCEVKIPIYAIGGIVEKDIAPLFKKTAVAGIAVSGLIKNTENKAEKVAEIKAALEKAQASR